MTGVILKFGICTRLRDKVSLLSWTLTLLRDLVRILILRVLSVNGIFPYSLYFFPTANKMTKIAGAKLPYFQIYDGPAEDFVQLQQNHTKYLKMSKIK